MEIHADKKKKEDKEPWKVRIHQAKSEMPNVLSILIFVIVCHPFEIRISKFAI
jgi:hypothetical protein